MMKQRSISLFVLLFFSLVSLGAQAQLNKFFSETDKFLKRFVDSEGMVDYARINDAPSQLNDLVAMVAKMDLHGASSKERKAFYINAYNILVIHTVIERDPGSSVTNVDGFFDAIKHKVADQYMTLNELEKQELLARYKDPRIHFAVVCGAVDCPPLANYAYNPAKLDEQLTRRTRKALDDPSFLKIDKGRKKILISQLFKWYKSDLTIDGQMSKFINKYRSEPLPGGYSLAFYKYDWSLNSQ